MPGVGGQGKTPNWAVILDIKSYRDLKVWQRALDLVVESYELAKRLPREEVYGLAGQIRRACTSIPANIAEGHGREHIKEYLRHLSIANGSLMELETHLAVAVRLSYLRADETRRALELSAEVGRMLSGLIRKLKARVGAEGSGLSHLTPGT